MKNYQAVKTTVCAVLMSLAMAVSAFAATGKISFSDPTVKEGEEVNVTMKIAADDGAQLSNATVTLSYDPGKLEFVAGTDVTGGGAGTVRLSGASNGAGTSELQYNLKFKTLAAGQSAVNINTQEVYDSAQQPVEISHLGTSTITVNAGETVSADASLSALEVAPGELSPAFSPDTTSYEVTVGTSVDQLSINALPADGSSSVVLSGNDALTDGDNNVTVRVTAPDGQTVRDYTIVVHRVEGGAENTSDGSTEASSAETGESENAPATETESSGVQLSSKGKTITIMNPGSDVKIPDGFKSSTITVDGQQVQGWVWGAEQNPQYCVVYGMNDQGELNFYRYDMAEKTIQRYFEDPLAANSVSNQEYTALQQEYDALSRNYDMRFFVICILILVGLILLATVIYLFAKLRTAQQTEQKAGPKSRDWRENAGESRSEDYSVYDEELLRHNYDEPEAGSSEPALDETQVLRRPQPRRRARNMGDTMPIPTVVSPSGKEEPEKKAPEKEKTATQTDDKDDNEFDTFHI